MVITPWARRLVAAMVVALVLIALEVAPAGAAHWRGSVYVGVGPVWWGPSWWYHPYWAYPPYWPYYPAPSYVYPPPPVVVEEAPVYIQQPPPRAAAPAPPDGPYWYYCPSAGAYYPAAPSCPEPWVKVPPRPEEPKGAR
jgi:hypothetical protein